MVEIVDDLPVSGIVGDLPVVVGVVIVVDVVGSPWFSGMTCSGIC